MLQNHLVKSYLSSLSSFIRSSISAALSCSLGNVTVDFSGAALATEAPFAASPDFASALPNTKGTRKSYFHAK